MPLSVMLRRETLDRALPWLRRCGGALALGVLLVEFGFPLSWAALTVAHSAITLVAALLAFEVLYRFARAPNFREHVAGHWLELIATGSFLLAVVATALLAEPSSIFRLSVTAAQGYVVCVLLMWLVETNERILALATRPAVVLLGSFLVLILAGTLLLMLPACRAPGAAPWGFLDALFTATSAACVTGSPSETSEASCPYEDRG